MVIYCELCKHFKATFLSGFLAYSSLLLLNFNWPSLHIAENIVAKSLLFICSIFLNWLYGIHSNTISLESLISKCFFRMKLSKMSFCAVLLIFPFFYFNFGSRFIEITLKLAAFTIFPFLLYIMGFYEEIELVRIKGFFNKYVFKFMKWFI